MALEAFSYKASSLVKRDRAIVRGLDRKFKAVKVRIGCPGFDGAQECLPYALLPV